MKMFLSSGYLNMYDIITNKYPFVFISGGRGTGKTYGGLLSILKLLDAGKINKFLYLRRTQKELDHVTTDATQPFKTINKDHDRSVVPKTAKDGFYYFKEDDKIIGYGAALSTFRNLKSVDFYDVDIIFYDEFIPMKGAYTIQDEYNTLLNMYESINRNRELTGSNPVKMVCCSNSVMYANKIFLGLNIIPQVEKLALAGGGTHYDVDRGLQVIILRLSPISEKKQQTALYKLAAGTVFAGMAIGNQFPDLDMDLIRPSNLNQYNILVTLPGIAIYKHKSKNEYYCCNYEKPSEYTSSERDLEKFQNRFFYLYNRYVDGQIFFQDLLTKYTFLAYNNNR